MSTTAIGSTTPAISTPSASPAATDPFAAININDYFKLIISGLQNQDPTSPMDTSTMLNQVSQLVNVESTRNLQTSLNAVALGQTLNNASGLINKTIDGLDDKGNDVKGLVSQVSISNGAATLQVKDSSGATSNVSLSNVRSVTS